MEKVFKFIIKVLGKVMVYPALPFRGYARSVVYNYVLQNNMPLKRLYERSPKWDGRRRGWSLKDVHNIRERNSIPVRGFIKYRKVSKLQYYAVVFLFWGWLDDDSNEDTTDLGYIETLVNKERYQLFSRIALPLLKKVKKRGDVVFGNAFDLGGAREDHKYCNIIATFFWNNRNTGMNFQYLFMDY